MRLLLLALFAISCAASSPNQPVDPFAGGTQCIGDVGDKMRDRVALWWREPMGTFYENAPCYACTKANDCFTKGGDYCCHERMCSECQAPPIPLGAKAPDGGAPVDGGAQ